MMDHRRRDERTLWFDELLWTDVLLTDARAEHLRQVLRRTRPDRRDRTLNGLAGVCVCVDRSDGVRLSPA